MVPASIWRVIGAAAIAIMTVQKRMDFSAALRRKRVYANLVILHAAIYVFLLPISIIVLNIAAHAITSVREETMPPALKADVVVSME